MKQVHVTVKTLGDFGVMRIGGEVILRAVLQGEQAALHNEIHLTPLQAKRLSYGLGEFAKEPPRGGCKKWGGIKGCPTPARGSGR